MEDSILINQRVKIIATYSYSLKGEPNCTPKRMIYKNKEYNFSELGLKHPTVKGKRMIHVFDMTDGAADYRLEFDAEALSWMLVCISDSHHAF